MRRALKLEVECKKEKKGSMIRTRERHFRARCLKARLSVGETSQLANQC